MLRCHCFSAIGNYLVLRLTETDAEVLARNVASFQTTTLIYDATCFFYGKFIDSRSRTFGQGDRTSSKAARRLRRHRKRNCGWSMLCEPAWTSCCWTTKTTPTRFPFDPEAAVPGRAACLSCDASFRLMTE